LAANIKAQDNKSLKGVFLVHGEESSMQALADTLEQDGYKVTIPEKSVVYEL
jgi:metallo-beta-lactamase family protein